MALTLDMKAVTTTKKWDVDDGVSYGWSLATGDQIVVRHSRKMDAKLQSSKAKVMIITASKTEAEGLQKTLDAQARKAMKIAPKKPSGPLSPSEIQNERDLLSELVCESADGQHADEDEAWVSESAEAEHTERSASPQLQMAQTLDREYTKKPRSPSVESRCWLFNSFTGLPVKRELNPNQRRILEGTRLSLKTGGFGKVELFPRSNVWVCGTRFKTFKSELHRNPLIDAVDLHLLFFGPRHNALDLFVGRGFRLQAALGNGVVNDIVGWINSFHPVSMHDERARVTSTEVVTAFNKRLYNMRKSMDPGEGTSGVQSKDLVFESDDEAL
ncbi:hypothetical protein RvY_01873 [Ramazzottius varieornatus]|uniref:Uncharacterized protein n=1 Tax=Ramazzottius varieornatus TaxID=947166 RepID=A0A1D1UPW1_RAMVA|nr:hypothetical protein RvY_01873 [Ramazzottius varieornatus]